MSTQRNEMEYCERVLSDIKASLVTLDLQGYITGWNQGAEALFGYLADEALGRHILMLYAEDDDDDDATLFNTVLTQGRGEMEVRRRKKNGDIFWANLHFTLARDDNGRPVRMVGFLRDITDRMEAEERTRLHSRIFESANDAIIVTNPQRQIVSVNPAFCRITGFCADEVTDTLPGFLLDAGDAKLAAEINATLVSAGHWEGELWDKRKHGEAFPAWVIISAVRDETGKVLNYFCVFSDLTERKNAEAQIHRLAYYDQLTNLPNRALLFSLLEQALAESRRNNRHGAVLCFNIAGFKHINDSFGHTAADRLLVELAQRLRLALREADIVSRSGADEFFIGVFDIHEREDVTIVIRRILETVVLPFVVKEQEVLLSAHVGVAVFPDDGRDPETIINKSAVALSRARENGQESLFYSAEMNRRSLARITLETELRHAIERNEFLLHYQPQYDQRQRKLIGAETLVRWLHPQRGLIPPNDFIPFAEESGLILGIGEWVANEAVRQMGEWRRRGIHVPILSINLSARQFRSGLVEYMQALCERQSVMPQQIELEITETLLMHGDAQVTGLLHALHEAGFALALDDFGTGYSNLAYLHKFPFDTIKIDRSFVSGLPDAIGNVALTRAIIGIAQSLGLTPIAEGVETEQEAHFLLENGCDRLQGYHFSRPLAAADFVQLVQRNTPA